MVHEMLNEHSAAFISNCVLTLALFEGLNCISFGSYRRKRLNICKKIDVLFVL